MQLTIDSARPVVLTVQPVGAGSPPARARSSERVSGTTQKVGKSHHSTNVGKSHNAPEAPRPTSLILGGSPVRVGADGYVSLTDLWRHSGASKSRNPYEWLKRESVQEFLTYVATTLSVSDTAKMPYHSERGKKATNVKGETGGTWAHWQVAMAYAKFLSPKFHAEVNEAYRRFSAEQASPELAVERAVDNWSERGHSPEWIAGRTQGVVARKVFTRTLAQSGVRGDGYRQATNAIYTPLFGGGADHIRTRRGLKATAPLRDHLSLTELAAIHLAECVSADEIKAKNARGNAECAHVCEQSSRRIAHALPRRCA